MKGLITFSKGSLVLFLFISEVYAKGPGIMYFADTLIHANSHYSGNVNAGRSPWLAIGAPSNSADTSVDLRQGGLIELGFVNGRLTNSGDESVELYIFEVGGAEATFVSIRPTPETALLLGSSYDADVDGYYEVGRASGGATTMDIDSVFPGYPAGTLVFDAVQLIDDKAQGDSGGADISGVGVLDFRCVAHLEGDLNNDCEVNMIDFALLAQNWLVNCNSDIDNPACHPILNLEGEWRFAVGDNSQRKNPSYDDSKWAEVILPDQWEHQGYTQDSVYGWYRKTITIPAAWSGRDLKLILGRIDDTDETFFNGQLIGNMGQMPPNFISKWVLPRQYTIPANLILFGEDNYIAVRIYDTVGAGGIYSGPLRIEIK